MLMSPDKRYYSHTEKKIVFSQRKPHFLGCIFFLGNIIPNDDILKF